MEKTRIYRSLPVLALLMLCLLLTGCGRSGSAPGAPAQADPAAPATPEPVHFAAGDVSPTAESVTLRLASGEDPLKVCEAFVKKYVSFCQELQTG